MVQIINFGSLNIDYVYKVDHFTRPGETQTAQSRSIFPGGKGLNQTIAAVRAGASISHCGGIGETGGDLLAQVLENDGVSLEFLRRDAAPTGHALIEVDPGGQNRILLYPGANHGFTTMEIDAVLGHFQPGDFLLLQLETNLADYIIRQGSARGLRVCCNAAPCDVSARRLPLELCDYLIVNEIEAAILGSVPKGQGEPCALASRLHKLYPKTHIVLTAGERGALCLSPDGNLVRQGCFAVAVVDTTGAGDTFTGYLLAALCRGEKPSSALLESCAAAALAVGRQGAVPSIPHRSEVQDFLAAHEAISPNL